MISTARIKKKLYLTVARYFRFFANLSLKRWRPRVIAVTGSVGKTTLLNLLEVQLGERAHYSHGANSSYGIAFDILGLSGVYGSKLKWLYLLIIVPLRSAWFRHSQEFYIVEIDGDRPTETGQLASWLKPEVTFWVSVGRSHAEPFDELVQAGLFETVDEAIVHEFASLPKSTSQLVIYDADNEQIIEALKSIDTHKIGIKKEVLAHYAVWPDRTELTVCDVEYQFTEPMPREVYTQLAMLGALADYLDEPVATDLSSYVQPPGRSNFLPGKNNVKLIDSSYNAHLISVESIVRLYSEMQTDQKWLVIGDIVEQGESEAKEHTRLGEILRKTDFERYILVGRRTQKWTYPEMDQSKTVTFLRPGDALKYLERELKGGETVLFKGSQYLEGIIEHLLENPTDTAKLPRQEPAAKKRRAKWGL